MPLVYVQPPREVRERAVEYMATRLGFVSRAAMALRGSRTRVLESPHRVFVVGDIGHGDRIDSVATPTAWRFLTTVGSQPAAVEVREHGHELLVEVERGPAVVDTQAALATATELTAAESSPYDPRLLRAPAIRVAALWLHTVEAPDVLFVLASRYRDLEGGPLSEEQFVEMLASLQERTYETYIESGGRPDEAGQDLGS